jgi:hypothetical protein
MATALSGGSASAASMRSLQPFECTQLRLDSRRYQSTPRTICYLLFAMSFEAKARMARYLPNRFRNERKKRCGKFSSFLVGSSSGFNHRP